MLNFEETVKAASHGYVVLSLDEYNRIRDEARAAKDFMDKLVNLEYNSWGKAWEVVVNSTAIYDEAMKKLVATLGDSVSEHDIVEPKDFAYYDHKIATRKPESNIAVETVNRKHGADDDDDDILNSDHERAYYRDGDDADDILASD